MKSIYFVLIILWLFCQAYSIHIKFIFDPLGIYLETSSVMVQRDSPVVSKTLWGKHCFVCLFVCLFVLLLHRLAEGELAITGGCFTNSKPLETIASDFGTAAGYALALLGQICR